MDPMDLVAEVARTAAAGAVGVWLGASLQDRRRRRIEAVDRVVPALEDVLRLVRYAPTHADPREWIQVASEALNAAEAVLGSAPRRGNGTMNPSTKLLSARYSDCWTKHAMPGGSQPASDVVK